MFLRAYIAVYLSAVTPIISTPPQSGDVQNGTSYTFTCAAPTAFPTPTWTWQFRANSQGPFAILTPNGATFALNSTYRVSNPQFSDVGLYVCMAHNNAGADDKRATLDVNGKWQSGVIHRVTPAIDEQ